MANLACLLACLLASSGGGGLSDSVVVPVNAILSLPSSIPLNTRALVEPLQLLGTRFLQLLSGPNQLLVLGGGLIGLAVVQCLAVLQTKKIIISEASKSRQ